MLDTTKAPNTPTSVGEEFRFYLCLKESFQFHFKRMLIVGSSGCSLFFSSVNVVTTVYGGQLCEQTGSEAAFWIESACLMPFHCVSP